MSGATLLFQLVGQLLRLGGPVGAHQCLAVKTFDEAARFDPGQSRLWNQLFEFGYGAFRIAFEIGLDLASALQQIGITCESAGENGQARK